MPALETLTPLRQQLEETRQAIVSRSTLRPRIGVIVGSGLGGLTGALTAEAVFGYAELPYMPRASAPGHEGQLVLGRLGAQPLAVLNGRFHAYEGYGPGQITYPVRLVRALGAEALILTAIVGSMNPAMPPGSLVLLEDHINLMGFNPLTGPNDDAMGARFPDMSAPYDAALRRVAREVAAAQGVALPEGVYAGVAGPNLETRAEYRFLRQIGADVVGMSVVPEVIAARHAGLRVLAVAVVSDACIPETLKPASIEELLRVAAQAGPTLATLLAGVIGRLDEVGG